MRRSIQSRLCGLILGAALALAPAVAATGGDTHPTPGPAAPVAEWMAWYYVTPQPERIPDFLVWLSNDRVLAERPASVASVAAFLAPIFAAEPDKIRERIHADKLDDKTRDMTIRALWLAGRADTAREIFGTLPDYAASTPPAVTARPPASPADVEALWSTFMATGDPAAVRRLVDALDESVALTDDRTVEKATRTTAANSFATTAIQHELVLRVLVEEARRRPPQAAKVIMAILAGARASAGSFPKAAGDFSAHVAVSDLADLTAAAAKGPDVVPFTSTARARTDRKVVVKAFFMGQQLDDRLTSDVTWDVVITDPRGRPWSGPDLIGLEGLKGRTPMRHRVFDARGFATLWFTKADPKGIYRIRAVVRDNVGKHEIVFDETLEHVR